MHYVYLLRSLKDPTKTYVGYTTNLEERIQKHNAGGSIFTANFRPWKIVTSICFDNESKAAEFEKYLKGGSGYAFAQKRFW
jgi:predicted GIY-YIG superfamily endonuclease